MSDIKVTDSHLTFLGKSYFRGGAPEIEMGSYGEKKTPITKTNYLEVQGKVPATKLKIKGNCSASLVADRLMSRPDVSCGGEGPRGVDLGCIVRQFVSEPHDDAARRSLHSFAVREGCLDRGPAGAG